MAFSTGFQEEEILQRTCLFSEGGPVLCKLPLYNLKIKKMVPLKTKYGQPRLSNDPSIFFPRGQENALFLTMLSQLVTTYATLIELHH